MKSDIMIHVGELVTVNDVKYGFCEKTFHLHTENSKKTIRVPDVIEITKGSVGIALNVENDYVKVLWNKDRQSVILYMIYSDLFLLDYDI